MNTVEKVKDAVSTIKAMAAAGSSRDDVMMWLFTEGFKPSQMNGLIKQALVKFGRSGSGWRQATSSYFAELDGSEPSYNDWAALMRNEGDNLLSDNNIAAYTNHFKLWVTIKNNEVMS